MEKLLIEEMTSNDLAGFKQALSAILTEMDRSFERMRAADERMAQGWAEIERLKQETKVISDRTDKFMDAHFPLVDSSAR